MTPTPPSVLKRLPGWIWPLAAGLVLLALVWLIAFEVALAGLRAEARTDARTRALSIASELSRQQTAGAVLASDPQVVAAQKAPSEAAHLALSRRLEALNDDIGASVLYVTDDQGNATSASNWDEDGSFVGSSYGYRAYVTQALASGEGREYALGSVSHRPGLYLSRRIGSKADPLGVVVVKLEFHALEANWRASARPSYVVDATGTVTLTSDPALRFQSAPATGHWSVSTPVPRSDWALVLTLPRGPVFLRAGVAVLVVALMLAGGLLLWQGMRRRQTEAARYRDRLERAVETRTRALSQQIHEREEAEAQLAGMQAALVQANKLASLGQISAGVAHEINQPLSTIRLLAEYGQDMLPEGDVPVRENLCQIVAMSHRIETITSDLKGFARKARGEQAPVSLAEAWLASLRLAASRRASNPVEVRSDPIPADLRVMAETVRLEQVLVNLLQNAQEALAGREDGRINMRLEVSQERVRIWISDNGPGLAPQVAEAPFTPFQTTKPGGLGLGLVICQGIVRDFGGDLRPDPRPGLSGACFRLELQRWSAP